MKKMIFPSIMAAAILLSAGSAMAAGELNIFNWGDYTSPELITKFEKKFDVKVTITDYDANDTAIAKIRAGGHGYDIAVPSASYVPIWVKEGLLLESRPDQMENFKNMDPRGSMCLLIPAAITRCRGSGERAECSSIPSSTRVTPTPPPFSLIRRKN